MQAQDALIDQATIAQIRQLESVRPGVLRQLLALFESSGQRQLELIDSQLRPPAHEVLRVAFHTLKGSAASLGALRCAAAAESAEHAAAAGADAATLTSLACALREIFDASRVALAEAIAGQ